MARTGGRHSHPDCLQMFLIWSNLLSKIFICFLSFSSEPSLKLSDHRRISPNLFSSCEDLFPELYAKRQIHLLFSLTLLRFCIIGITRVTHPFFFFTVQPCFVFLGYTYFPICEFTLRTDHTFDT